VGLSWRGYPSTTVEASTALSNLARALPKLTIAAIAIGVWVALMVNLPRPA
jgi:hypothetical protein